MAGPIKIDVRAEELLLHLAQLQGIIDSKDVITAERKAAKMLMDRGYNRLVATLIGNSDNLVNSFTYALRGGASSLRGIRVGFKRPGGNVAHLVDRGTKERYTKNGAYRGKIVGSHFWTDTTDQYSQEAMDIMIDGIENAFNKLR